MLILISQEFEYENFIFAENVHNFLQCIGLCDSWSFLIKFIHNNII